MAVDPRLTEQYDNIQDEPITAKVDNVTLVYDGNQIGGCVGHDLAVTLSGDSTVALTADAQSVYGQLVQVEWDGYCTVKAGGFMKLPAGSAATVTPGTKIVGALGAASAKGFIRSVAAATLAEVAVARGIIVDHSDTTNVVVRLP